MLKIGPLPAGTSGLKSLPNYAEAELVADAEVDVDVKVGVELSVVKVVLKERSSFHLILS